MRIFRFWVKYEEDVAIDGDVQKSVCYGGSNKSAADAIADAQRKIDLVRRRISGEPSDTTIEQEYEADIREEIVCRLDDQNIVTRNRYGAEVLNSTNVMFLDIDEAPTAGFWFFLKSLFSNNTPKKERIVEFVKTQIARPECQALSVRLYETCNGIRLIVQGEQFDPKAEHTALLMRKFNTDRLYALLCRKQGCFRARLTPKPHRMRCKTHKVVFPRENDLQEKALAEWLKEYDSKRKGFRTCKYLESFGPEHVNPVVEFHDKSTGVRFEGKLA